jgi:hypothetical protein
LPEAEQFYGLHTIRCSALLGSFGLKSIADQKVTLNQEQTEQLFKPLDVISFDQIELSLICSPFDLIVVRV